MRASPPSELIQFAGRLGQELATLQHAILQTANAEPAMAGTYGPRDSARRTLYRNSGLTEKLLAFAGQLDLTPEQLDLSSWLQEFIKLQRFKYPAGIQLETKIPEGNCTLQIDRDWLRHALTELLDNAVEAMPGGGRLTLILTHMQEQNRDWLRLAVRDTGIGMAPALLAHALEPMVTTKGNKAHHGWGLPVCQGFARQSGGWLELDSTYRRGTTATLVLPQTDTLFPALHLGRQG